MENNGIRVTPEMMKAGLREVLRLDVDIYETTPSGRLDEMLAYVYRAMSQASQDGRSGII